MLRFRAHHHQFQGAVGGLGRGALPTADGQEQYAHDDSTDHVAPDDTTDLEGKIRLAERIGGRGPGLCGRRGEQAECEDEPTSGGGGKKEP